MTPKIVMFSMDIGDAPKDGIEDTQGIDMFQFSNLFVFSFLG